ncbi:hypothetical protein FQN54_003436 [Arachnomyces sp. PD_36]|nr:hypothetical protein FQN54_003436 [Arachnomyces sp. PD_36]
MPVLTRNQEHQQQREKQDVAYKLREDRVSECAGMFPVFCTANIPPNILDDFIDQAYEGFADCVNDPGPSHICPCILQTKDLDSIAHGSRKPMPKFESPFLNYTDDEIREWFKENICGRSHPDFAQSTFTILDQDTVEKGVCRMGYVDGLDPDEDLRMIRTDPYVDLYIRPAIEECTEDWDDEVRAADGRVSDRRLLEREHAELNLA